MPETKKAESKTTLKQILYAALSAVILGANLFYDVIVHLSSKDLSIDALGISDSRSLSVGDIVIEPFGLVWRGPKYDYKIVVKPGPPGGHFQENPFSSALTNLYLLALTAAQKSGLPG